MQKHTHTHTQTHTHTHRDSNEYPIVAFSKNATIMTALGDLNLHKSDGHAGLFSDNLIYGPHVLCVYLSLLYTAILYHGFLPDNLLTSVVVPIPKNVKGNMGSSDNYRGIALCSSITKLFDI